LLWLAGKRRLDTLDGLQVSDLQAVNPYSAVKKAAFDRAALRF